MHVLEHAPMESMLHVDLCVPERLSLYLILSDLLSIFRHMYATLSLVNGNYMLLTVSRAQKAGS